MKVYLVQRLSLLGLVVCCLQMGSVNAIKFNTAPSIATIENNLKHPQNKKLLTSINYNIDSLNRSDTDLAATYEGMLLIDTKGIIKNLFPTIDPESLKMAGNMRDLLVEFDNTTFQQFPAYMQIAFISIVNQLARLKNASAKIKKLAQELNSMSIVEPLD